MSSNDGDSTRTSGATSSGSPNESNWNVMRVRGYAFLYDSGTTGYIRSAEQRTRVISLIGNGLIINLAPPETSIEEVRYEDQEGRLVVTDGGAFHLDINEFGRNR